MLSPFKTGFNIKLYKDILPAIPSDEREIINIQIDDPLKQVWTKQPFPDVITQDFVMGEANRLKEGVWILNKGVLLWIPPNYYQFLQYGTAGGKDPQFRLKRLKNVYTKIKVRKDARFLGTYNIKNRQDGDTTFAMSDALWEVNSGFLNHGMIGIQSKTRDDAINPCWFNMKSIWNAYPIFFKQAFYNSFSSGVNIEQKLQFTENADPKNPYDKGKNIVIQYGPAVYNAFDGKSNMRKCILDEVNKWVVCRFIDTFINYKKFIMPGKQRRGLFDIFSSPSDTNGDHNDDAYKFWKDSDPDDIQENGSTKSRILRMYSNPLEGIDDFYDEFGDCDPQEIYEHILRERKSARPEKLMAEIRAYPLPILNTDRPNEEELFGATDTPSIWSNAKGIKDRAIFLKSQKDKVLYCNLDWPLNTQDSGIPVIRPSGLDVFDDDNGRFCFTTTQLPKVALRDIRKPPHLSLIESCIGVDSYNAVNQTKDKTRASKGAGVEWRYKDLSNSGWEQAPIGLYYGKPYHKDLFYEDMIKWAVFSRAMIQYESSDGGEFADHVLQRGYEDWMLDSRDKKLIETPQGFLPRKGDSPAGRGSSAFMNELISLIDGVTNIPFNATDKYLLELYFWFEEMCQDISEFDRENTLRRHITMALGQALLGRNKILFRRVKKKSSTNNRIVDYLLS